MRAAINKTKRMWAKLAFMRSASIANYREAEIRLQSLALARLIARGRLVDDIDAALAANEPVVAVTGLERLERILDLHGPNRSSLPEHWLQ
jgi:hypothetical protein